MTTCTSDDRLLAILAMRRSGIGCNRIGAAMGLLPSTVTIATGRVRRADELQIGEAITDRDY